MTMMTVYRDAQGAVLNIGAWDLMIENVPVEDASGFIIGHNAVVHNPLPAGATQAQEEVETGADGSRQVAEE